MYSSLKANPLKSSYYLSNPPPGLKQWISSVYGIEEGSFPTKFLGVPLITQKLKSRDCQPLLARITSRIDTWTVKFLSFAGRLQLNKSVLQGIYSFWCAHFILPQHALKHIQSLLSRFLWNRNSHSNSKTKVAWDVVTLPKEEGGLGLKDVITWNKALILKHFLDIIKPYSNSLWADWVKATILRDSSMQGFKS